MLAEHLYGRSLRLAVAIVDYVELVFKLTVLIIVHTNF